MASGIGCENDYILAQPTLHIITKFLVEVACSTGQMTNMTWGYSVPDLN